MLFGRAGRGHICRARDIFRDTVFYLLRLGARRARVTSVGELVTEVVDACAQQGRALVCDVADHLIRFGVARSCRLVADSVG